MVRWRMNDCLATTPSSRAFPSINRGRHRKRKIKHVKPASTPGASGAELARTRPDKGEISKGRTFEFKAACVVPSLYRPFTKQWLYFNRTFNEMVLQMPRIFPKAGAENLLIMVKQRMSNEGQFVLMVNSPPELQTGVAPISRTLSN